MPELPEIESLSRFLTRETAGRTIAKVSLSALSALKTYDPPLDALVERKVKSWSRRGKFLILDASADEPLFLTMHLSRGGWVKRIAQVSTTPIKIRKGPLALRMVFDDGSGIDVTEAGTEKRLAISVVRSPDDVPHIATLGPDVLNELTVDEFGRILREHNAQLKGVLTSQGIIAGVGNAYSDEALHVAHLSPFRKAASLTDDEVSALFGAIHQVMTEAIERSAELGAADLKSDKKSHMRVHGRTGQKCPECGDTVREVSFATKSLQYCATCQTSGKILADRRMSRLLK